jgi:hypothetical protein
MVASKPPSEARTACCHPLVQMKLERELLTCAGGVGIDIAVKRRRES